MHINCSELWIHEPELWTVIPWIRALELWTVILCRKSPIRDLTCRASSTVWPITKGASCPSWVMTKKVERKSRSLHRGLLWFKWTDYKEINKLLLINYYFVFLCNEKFVANHQNTKLGTMMGVYFPCIQNIFGIIFFIRYAWVIGMAGWLQALVIVTLCCLCVSLVSLLGYKWLIVVTIVIHNFYLTSLLLFIIRYFYEFMHCYWHAFIDNNIKFTIIT